MAAEVLRAKWIHGATAALTVAVAVPTTFVWPELLADAGTALGTAGFFTTAYGVAFTVVELLRRRTATELAARAAQGAQSAMAAIVTVSEIAGCRAKIDLAMEAVREQTPIPSPTLRQIAEVYVKLFFREVTLPDTEHRKNKDLLDSFDFSGKGGKLASQRLWECLARISGHFAALEMESKRFTELRK